MLLLAGIGWLFCTLFFGDSAENAGTDRLTDGVEAVPSDAIFLFEAASLSDAAEFVDGGSALGRLLECIPDHASEWEAALSMHYSTKNEVSPLLVVSIPEDEDAEALMNRILQKCGGVVDKRYGSVTVHKSAVPDASFAEYGSFLIASPSLVIVEASLRHLENGTSIKDNPLYSRISGVSSESFQLQEPAVDARRIDQKPFRGAREAGSAPDFQRFGHAVHGEEIRGGAS